MSDIHTPKLPSLKDKLAQVEAEPVEEQTDKPGVKITKVKRSVISTTNEDHE